MRNPAHLINPGTVACEKDNEKQEKTTGNSPSSSNNTTSPRKKKKNVKKVKLHKYRFECAKEQTWLEKVHDNVYKAHFFCSPWWTV